MWRTMRIANFCFGEDGIMKTGKQTIFNEETGETENWFFHTDGDKERSKGIPWTPRRHPLCIRKRQDATADQRYAPADLNGTTYLVGTAGNVQKSSASSTSTAKPELGRGYKDIKDANGTIWTVKYGRCRPVNRTLNSCEITADLLPFAAIPRLFLSTAARSVLCSRILLFTFCNIRFYQAVQCTFHLYHNVHQPVVLFAKPLVSSSRALL